MVTRPAPSSDHAPEVERRVQFRVHCSIALRPICIPCRRTSTPTLELLSRNQMNRLRYASITHLCMENHGLLGPLGTVNPMREVERSNVRVCTGRWWGA